MIAKLLGAAASRRLLAEVSGGAYELAPFGVADVARAAEIVERWADLEIGLADASIVVLSERHDTVRLLSLDERHFRSLRGARGRRFRLLPFENA